MSAVLSAQALVGGYGDADILHEVGLEVGVGDIVVIVGPNGAGKSTALKALFGLVRLRSGRVMLMGGDITGAEPDAIVRCGMAYVPQERNVFPSLTVHENLEMGAYTRRGSLADAFDKVYGLFPPLKERRSAPAGVLSGGQRQMVAIGRALMLDPKVLLLDEPTRGIDIGAKTQIQQLVADLAEKGMSVVFISAELEEVLRLSHRLVVLKDRRKIDERPNRGIDVNDVLEIITGEPGGLAEKERADA
jgi:branched-chain amino acid transport system ATP-binding protein